MTQCCDANGYCQNGPGCPLPAPAKVAPAHPLRTRSCDDLGVCQGGGKCDDSGHCTRKHSADSLLVLPPSITAHPAPDHLGGGNVWFVGDEPAEPRPAMLPRDRLAWVVLMAASCGISIGAIAATVGYLAKSAGWLA